MLTWLRTRYNPLVRKRILHVIPTLDRAGAEKQLVLLASGLVRRGFDVHVCVLTRDGPLRGELESSGIRPVVLGKRWKVDPFAFWQLRRTMARLRPELVQTWIFAANTYGRAAALTTGVPHLVASERCVDRWKAPYEFALDRALAHRTHRIVVNCTSTRDFYVQHGIPRQKFEIIPNGIPVAEPSSLPREELLRELELPANTRLIGVVGRLWPQKRVKDLIWASDLVWVLHPNVCLVVIGDGPQRPMLERFTRLLDAQARVRFLGQRDDVLRIMPHFDVFWQGSEYEGLPNAVMEAMAAGVPVVATDVDGNRDLVIPDETGFLVPVGDRAGRTRATDRILNDSELAQRLAECGRRRVQEHFGVETMIERYATLYCEILDGL